MFTLSSDTGQVLQVRQPRLEIKKDSKGMVVVPGAILTEVTSAKQLMDTFERVGIPSTSLQH